MELLVDLIVQGMQVRFVLFWLKLVVLVQGDGYRDVFVSFLILGCYVLFKKGIDNDLVQKSFVLGCDMLLYCVQGVWIGGWYFYFVQVQICCLVFYEWS